MWWWHRDPHLTLRRAHTLSRLSATLPLFRLLAPSSLQAWGPVCLSSVAFGAHRAHNTSGKARDTLPEEGSPLPPQHRDKRPCQARGALGSRVGRGTWRAGPDSFFLAPTPLTVEFLMHNPQGGEEVAKEEEEEGEAAHEHLGERSRVRTGPGAGPRSVSSPPPQGPQAHLPLLALRVPGQVEQGQRVKKLPELGGMKGFKQKPVPTRAHGQHWGCRPRRMGHRHNLRVQRKGRAAGR